MDRKRIKTELLVHDLKNPIVIIEAGINTLLSREEKFNPLDDRQVKILKRSLRNVRIMKGLVNDILEIGRSSEGVIICRKCTISQLLKPPLIEVFDLAGSNAAERIRACNDFLSMKNELSANDIFLSIDEALWQREVYLDSRKINQIFRNLLSNALKFRKIAIDISISVRNHRDQGENLTISVKDDGDGIEKIYHQKIFESYFQIDDEMDHCVRGHGLGLAGILILVEDMGGKMYLESGEGKGARFSVSLPLKEHSDNNIYREI
jgi:two-component system, OmpR family, sensor kinase